MRMIFAIGSGLALLISLQAEAKNIYVSPKGAGAKTGMGPSEAFEEGKLESAIAAAQSGDTIFLEGGAYNLTISLEGNGSVGKPKVLMGRVASSPPLFSKSSSTSGSGLSGSGVKHWVIQNLKFDGFGTAVKIEDAEYVDIVNLHSTNGTNPFWLNKVNKVKLVDCSAVKYEAKGYRISKGGGTSVEFVRCLADATGGDAGLIASRNNYCMGFWYDKNDGSGLPTSDIAYKGCVARNNLNSGGAGSYANGDGFCGENPAKGILYENCAAYDNMDGGYDVKSENVTYKNSIAFRNYRGFRGWEGTHTYVNCISGYNRNYGLWTGRRATAHITKSTFVGNAESTFKEESGEGGKIAEVSGSILLDKELGKLGAGIATGNVSDDPGFLAASKDWNGTPADAFNSAKYGLQKGYYAGLSATTGMLRPGHLPSVIPDHRAGLRILPVPLFSMEPGQFRDAVGRAFP